MKWIDIGGGVSLPVYDYIRWIAQDANGTWHGFPEKPKILEDSWRNPKYCTKHALYYTKPSKYWTEYLYRVK